MGYFSFYKIFQDIIRKLFNIKIWKICLVIFLILLLYSNFTKIYAVSPTPATDFTILNPNNNREITVNLPSWASNYYWLFLYRSVSSSYIGYAFFASQTPITISYSSSGAPVVYGDKIVIISSGLPSWNSISNILVNTSTPDFSSGRTSMSVGSNAWQNNNYMYGRANYDILDHTSGKVVFQNSIIKLPEIATSVSDLESLNFDVISVNAWSYSKKDFDILFYDRNVIDTTTTDGLYPKRVITLNQKSSYFQADLTSDENVNAIYWIPIDEIGLNLYIGGSYEIRLAERIPIQGGGGFRDGNEYKYKFLGEPVNFTVSSDVSQDKLNAINKEIEDMTNEKYHDETINKMDNINNNINNLSNSITDSNISSDIDLPTDNTQDITKNGIDNIFNNIYNAFTSGEVKDIVFPIPFTGKNITLPANYTYNMLNKNATWVIIFIKAFWAYIISRFIIKDISKKMTKIKSGSLESIENTNIKEDML